VFDKAVVKKLQDMRINSDNYYKYLSTKFANDVGVFNAVISFFNTRKTVGDHVEFLIFWQSNYKLKPIDTDLFNYAYELYNNLMRFYKGGVFCLFKFKQAEWGAPEILITDLDVPNNNEKHLLENHQVIYRGLHQLEHDSKDYYQSWTINKDKAIEFANDVYHGQPNNIVVHAQVNKLDVIYYNSDDFEQEVIVKKGVITGAKKI
jgi:hypothetical protein